ncbi:PLxRFG domain-containing protein [Acinetobacter sp. 256-1]|uniref:PLxRFG domain-containing protein n=1 Tax=Acinetobacter sp. 256-1 TaxID=2746721 RepID=UPI002575756A|nr:PLxRFG domain-containing protein [Acinetobacter sp. 256-1]
MSEQKPWEMDWSKQFKNQSDNSSKNPWEMNWGKQEPQKQEEKGFLGQAQDAGVSLLKGVVAVPETIVGLADIPTGGQVGKFIEEKTPIQFKQAKDALNDLHTDQYKKQQKQFSEAGQNEDSLVAKVIEKGKVALSNPSMIFNTVVESAPSMLAGGAVGRGLGMASQAIKPIAAGAIGEGAVMAGQQAENIRYETDDKLLTPEQSGASIATGAIGSLFGLLGGQVAKKLGFDDLETAMASGRMNSQLVGDSIQKMPLSSIPKSIIGGALTEGLVEELPQSVSEQLLQNIALDRPLDEGVDSAIVMGTLAGMAMGGGMNIVSAPKNFLQNNKAYSEQQNVIAQEQQQLADTNQDQEQHELVGPQIQYDNGFDYSSVPSNEDMNQSILDRILDDDFNEARSRIETAQAQGMNVDSAISQFNDLIARDYQPIDLENIEQIQGLPLEHQETEAFLHNIYDLIDSNDLIEARHRIEEVHKNGGDASQAAGYFNDLIQRQYQPIVSQQKQDTKYGNEVDFQQTLASDSWTMNDEAEEQRANYGNTVNYEHPNINTEMQTSAIPDFVFPSSQTLSERMGINPNDGPMSSAAALAVDTGASPVAHEQTQSSTLAAPQDLQQNENTPLSDASTYMDSAPTYSNPTAQDIQHGMSEIAKGAYEAAIENTIQRLNKDGEVVLFKENSITQALNDQNYNVRQNEDGSASIIGVKNPATNEWHGQSKEDVSQVSRLAETIADQQISQPQEQLTQTERVSQINQSIDDAELKFGNSRKVSEKKEIRQQINDLKNERQLLLEQGNQPTTNLNTENSNLNSQNTSLDAQNNTDKSQTNNVADQLAQLEQNFNAIKGNSVKQAIEKSKIKKQIDQLKFQQPEITTAPFGSEKIQKQYGDTAESVMSDIEILGDDFTIDLRDKNKKTNALNNPNYNAVQKADGSVEIVGMKHPTTGEWVGKKPSTISIEESAQNNMSESTQWTKHPTRKKTWIADNGMMITDESSLGKKTFYVFKDRSGYEQGDFLARAESLIDAKQKAVNILTKNSSEKLPKNTKPIESDPVTQPKNFKDSIENIRAEKIRQKDLADMHNSVYGLATDEQLQESLKHLNKEIKKAQKQSENEVVNGKRSTRKAVAAGALDRFLKNRVDLETYIKARKNGELKQRTKNIKDFSRKIAEQTQVNVTIQSDSEIGQTHFIPSHLMDSVNKLGDVVDDLALMRTEGVEYDHDYAVQLLNKIATLNPNIEVIFTRNPKLATGLSEGGYYPFSQDGTEKIYIYPQGNWESDILSLVNHELVHAVTYQAIAQNKVTKDDLNFLKKMSETLRNWMFKNPMALDEWIEYRFDYGINDQYHNELIAVFTAEFDVRQSFSSLQEQLFNESKEQATNFAGTQKNDHAEFQQTPSRDPASTERSSSASRESAENRASQSERQNNSNRTRETRTQVHFLDEFDDIVQRIMALNHEQHKQNRNAEKNKDKPLYSRQSASNSGSTIQQVRNVLVNRFGKETIDELERQGKLEIIQDYQVEGVEGFYHNGKAVLVASNLTAESTVPTFLHELGGHAGFQNMMNQKQYDELMNQFNKLVEQGNPVAMAAKVLAEREQDSERQQLEYLPYLLTLSATMQQRNVLQRNALQKLINNIISYVKAWVFDHFGINLNLNPRDMLALSERMIGQIKHQSSLDLVRQKYHGTHQWMKAPNGAATHLSEQQWLQVRTPEFKKWFGDWENDAANASQVLDENGEPKVVYHGTASEFNEFKQGHGILGDGIYLTDSFDTADVYANIRGKNGFVLPLFVNIRNAFQTTANVSRDEIVKATSTGKYQGVIHHFDDQEYIVALEPNQVKMAEGNTGTFNSESADIRFSRSAKDIIDNLSKNLSNISVSSIKDQTGYKFTDWLGIGLSALGRRQLTEIYSKLLPQLNKYNELAAQMDADKNDAGAEADSIVREWANLKDENELADLMHDATLAKIDPAKPYVPGDNHIKYQQLRQSFNALSPEAQDMYVKARDAYKKHYAKVQSAIKDRILRASLSSQKKADLIKQMDDQFYGYVKGVYFPLARFGKYVVVVRNQNGDVESVSRAETMGEAQKIRSEMLKKFPQWKVEPVIQDKEFRSARDAVGRGFMSSLFDEVANLGLSSTEQASFEDTLNQLYLSSMPDLSWAKHGIHRKGTAGFSQDARRAFAQNMFSGANYLAKLRYGDQLADQLDAMQKYADDQIKQNHQYNQSTAQSVIDEMNKRHENLMNPKGHPLSSALTSLGFIYYLGLSPAAAMVNLSQTALVAYPIMGAKWGFDKAGKELLKASNDFRKGLEFHKVKWQGTKTDLYKAVSSDISKFLSKDEKQAYEDAVARGVIDVTQAHDLAGIAQGEDSGIMWKTRPIMRAASVMFHSAERFNREVTFIAAYRLARQSGEKHDLAFDQAVDATYRGHFDYSSGNRPRIMQGNVAKVLLLFKQFGQNMLYTLARQTYQSIKGETDAEKKEARKSLAAILAMHATFAGTLGLPIVGMLLSLASWMGGDDDDPWDAEIALRNYLAEAFNPSISNMLMKGAPRSVGIDISSRVGINNLLLPDVQEGLEGKRWAESAMAGALGPVAGIGTNLIKGGQEISEGHNLRGVETMLPVFLKNFAKTYRYADEGVQDKTGISIMDEVSSMDLLVQGMGFSPSDVRTANEGKSAIYQFNRKLNERRSRLMTLWSRAKMMDDQQEMDKIWEEIQGFNDKNPSRRITRINLNQSYRNRQRRIDRAEDGIYLSRNRQDAREAGYFAFGE